MTLSQIRNSVDALCRKYAPELALYRARGLASEFCLQYAVAVADRKPAPETHPFIKRIVGHGLLLTTFMALNNYLERCRRESRIPECSEIVHCLLPWSRNSGLPTTSLV